jgi:hypothetical protein
MRCQIDLVLETIDVLLPPLDGSSDLRASDSSTAGTL